MRLKILAALFVIGLMAYAYSRVSHVLATP